MGVGSPTPSRVLCDGDSSTRLSSNSPSVFAHVFFVKMCKKRAFWKSMRKNGREFRAWWDYVKFSFFAFYVGVKNVKTV